MGLQAADCHKPSSGARASSHQATWEQALRIYRCARCGRLALCCRRCEHGRIYCARGCAQRARQDSLRRAGARYQRSRKGRRHHAARQARYRSRRQNKVTHQGPPHPAGSVDLRTSGLIPVPEKEDSHVPSPAVQDLSAAPVHSPDTAAASGAPATTTASTAQALGASQSASHRCHFCGKHQSAHLRRDFVFVLRRKQRTARARRPP
jgi:hypothetical protein